MQDLRQMKKLPVVVLPWGGEAGGEYVLWSEHIEMIGKLIQEFNLQVIEAKFLPKPFPGGKRGPHLHYGGAVYAVNPEQWKVFTDAVIKDCQARLGRAPLLGLRGRSSTNALGPFNGNLRTGGSKTGSVSRDVLDAWQV